MKPSFTDRELDIMAVLWERGPSTVAEIRARLDDELAHNTVQTFLRILEEKGYVAHTQVGRAHRFRARVKREVAGSSATTRLVEKMFGGSPERFLAHFVNERRMDAKELRSLRALLDDLVKKAER